MSGKKHPSAVDRMFDGARARAGLAVATAVPRRVNNPLDDIRAYQNRVMSDESVGARSAASSVRQDALGPFGHILPAELLADPAATELAATDTAATDTAATDPAATELAATDPAATDPAATELAAPTATDRFALALGKFFAPLAEKIGWNQSYTTTDEPPQVRDIHYTFDSRYADMSTPGRMVFNTSNVNRSSGSVYSMYEPSDVFELTLGSFSLPVDVPWGTDAEQNSRSEITVLFQELAAQSFADAADQHHFRGWTDSTDIAAYMFYSGTAGADIAAAVAANQSALVRWHHPKFVFTAPQSIRGTLSLVWRRSGVLIPFYKCAYTGVTVIIDGAGNIDLVFPTTVATANVGGLVVGDALFFQESVTETQFGSGVLIIAKDTQVLVTAVTAATRTVRIDATYGTAFTLLNNTVVVPKWRMRVDAILRGLTPSVTNFTRP